MTLREPRAHVGTLAVAHGLDEQFAQRFALEVHLAEHVENFSAERSTRLIQLLKQGVKHFAFTRFRGDEIPEVADFRLADAVDAAKPLLDAVRIPRQIVVHHQVRALEIDAFARGVGGEENLHVLVVAKCLLDFQPLLAPDTAVNDENRVGTSEQRLESCRGDS